MLPDCATRDMALRLRWSGHSRRVERKIRIYCFMGKDANGDRRSHVVKPPYRADQVGSLLRPAALASARGQFKSGALSAEELRQIEDVCIREVVDKQLSIGLRSITDGELRRDYWHID